MPLSARTRAATRNSKSQIKMSNASETMATSASGPKPAKPRVPVKAMQDDLKRAFGPRHKALKRSGMRPLLFDGELLAEASSHSAGTRMWYEINLYANDAGGYVAEVKAFLKPAEQKDMFRAEAFADLESMTEWLEAHDPAQDAVVDVTTADADAPLVLAALGAVRLRQSIDEARREYRYLVGELLFALDVAVN